MGEREEGEIFELSDFMGKGREGVVGESEGEEGGEASGVNSLKVVGGERSTGERDRGGLTGVEERKCVVRGSQGGNLGHHLGINNVFR